jgi:hypothetical protein
MSTVQYYEEILLGALALAEDDAERGRLDDKRLDNIVETVKAVIEDFGDHDAPTATAGKPGANARAAAADANEKDNSVIRLLRSNPTAVICLPGMGKLDASAAAIVADALKLQGVDARLETSDTPRAGEADGAAIRCMCFLERLSDARMRYTMRQIVKTGSPRPTIFALFGANSTESTGKQAQSGQPLKVAHSLQATLSGILTMLGRDPKLADEGTGS